MALKGFSVVKLPLLLFLLIKNMISRILISSGVFVLVVADLALGMGKGPTSRLGLAFPTHFGHFRIILILILVLVVR